MRKNNYLKALFVLIFVLLFAFVLVGCGDKNNNDDNGNNGNNQTEVDWDSKIINYCEIDRESFDSEYDIDDFKVELLKLHVVYTDSTDRLIPCNKNMFDDGDYKKLQSPGTKKVTVVYEKGSYYEEFEERVHIVDYSVMDEGLNRNKQYECVIKVIRNQVTNKLQFIAEPLKGIAGLQIKYVFDDGKIKFKNFVVNESTKGFGKFTFDEEKNTLNVDFVTIENIETETVLFTCDFEGDFRFSNLKVDETFANKVYSIKEDGSTEKMISVLYHVSKK